MSNVSSTSVKAVIWAAYLESQQQLAAMAARVSERDGEIVRLKAELAEATQVAKSEHAARQAATRPQLATPTNTCLCGKCSGTGQYGHLGACRACNGAGRVPVIANVNRLAKALVAVTGLGVKTQGSSILVRRTEGWCVPTVEELEAAHASLSS